MSEIDRLIHDKYFNSKKNGIFVELGAIDGIQLSHTLFLENEYNWTGVLIEPDERQFNKLINNRPMSKCYNFVISDVPNNIKFNLKKESACNFIAGLPDGGSKEYQEVIYPTKKMSELLHDANIKYIDYFCIDVEGAEYQVLTTMDWDIPVHIILIEIAATHELSGPKNEKCRKFLKEKGFEYVKTIEYDELWINNNYI